MPLIIFHLFHHIAFDLPICKDLKTNASYLDVDEYFLGGDLPKNDNRSQKYCLPGAHTDAE